MGVEKKEMFYSSGNLKMELIYRDNVLHHLNGPAVVKYDEIGNITQEFYYESGKLSRENNSDGPGPSKIFYYSNGLPKEEHFFIQDKYAAEDNLTLIKYYSTGVTKSEFYSLENYNLIKKYHRNGNLESENWFNKKTQKLHRSDDLPAVIYYSKTINNRVIREVWYNQGLISRLYNPAVIVYSQSGNHEAISKTFYINNERFEDELVHTIKSLEIKKRDH